MVPQNSKNAHGHLKGNRLITISLNSQNFLLFLYLISIAL